MAGIVLGYIGLGILVVIIVAAHREREPSGLLTVN